MDDKQNDRAERTQRERQGFWAWAKEYSSGITAVAALSVPFITALGGWYLTNAVSDREVQAQHLDIAVAILSDPTLQEQRTDEAVALRRYGVDLLDHSSPVEVPEAVRSALVDGTLILPEASLERLRELPQETIEVFEEIQRQQGETSG